MMQRGVSHSRASGLDLIVTQSTAGPLAGYDFDGLYSSSGEIPKLSIPCTFTPGLVAKDIIGFNEFKSLINVACIDNFATAGKFLTAWTVFSKNLPLDSLVKHALARDILLAKGPRRFHTMIPSWEIAFALPYWLMRTQHIPAFWDNFTEMITPVISTCKNLDREWADFPTTKAEMVEYVSQVDIMLVHAHAAEGEFRLAYWIERVATVNRFLTKKAGDLEVSKPSMGIHNVTIEHKARFPLEEDLLHMDMSNFTMEMAEMDFICAVKGIKGALAGQRRIFFYDLTRSPEGLRYYMGVGRSLAPASSKTFNVYNLFSDFETILGLALSFQQHEECIVPYVRPFGPASRFVSHLPPPGNSALWLKKERGLNGPYSVWREGTSFPFPNMQAR